MPPRQPYADLDLFHCAPQATDVAEGGRCIDSAPQEPQKLIQITNFKSFHSAPSLLLVHSLYRSSLLVSSLHFPLPYTSHTCQQSPPKLPSKFINPTSLSSVMFVIPSPLTWPVELQCPHATSPISHPSPPPPPPPRPYRSQPDKQECVSLARGQLAHTLTLAPTIGEFSGKFLNPLPPSAHLSSFTLPSASLSFPSPATATCPLSHIYASPRPTLAAS